MKKLQFQKKEKLIFATIPFFVDFVIYLNYCSFSRTLFEKLSSGVLLLSKKLYRFDRILLIFVFLVYSHLTVAGEIHESIHEKNMEKIQTLVKEDPGIVNTKDENGILPLFLAIYVASYSDRWDIVAFLINNGADLDITDKQGNTPLNLVIYWGKTNIAMLLVDNGADPNGRGRNGFTPLHEAIHGNHLKIAEYLIDNGADKHAKTRSGLEPLELAIYLNHLEMRDLLIRKGAKKRNFIERIKEPFWKEYHE